MAARALGCNDVHIMFSEILPNAVSPAIVNGSLQVARAILLEASMSFLGLGPADAVSWGWLLRNAQPFLRTAWWMSLFPGAAVLGVVLGLNLVGDGLNDALNPRLKEKGRARSRQELLEGREA